MALQNAVARGSIDWLRETSDFLMSNGDGASHDGFYSWNNNRLKCLYDGLPNEVQHALLSPLRHTTRTCDGNAKPTETQPADQEQDPYQTPGKFIASILMPHAIKLLSHFQPQVWAEIINKTQSLVILKRFRAEALLWGQLVVIDISIRLLLRRGLSNIDEEEIQAPNEQFDMEEYLNSHSKWELPEATLASSITQSWKRQNVPPDSEGQTSETLSEPLETGISKWDLASDLRNRKVIRHAEDSEEASRKCEILANLLKVRALFIVALFILGPDSSDIHVSETSSVRMPLI